MSTVERNGIVFETDKEANKEYYRDLSVCDCLYCKNYYAQIAEKRAQLQTFFNELGVDLLRCDEVMSFDTPNTQTIDYIACYTVNGRLGENTPYELDIEGAYILLEPFDPSDPKQYFPNERITPQNLFSLSLYITLPWVLEKSLFPEKSSFLQRLKNFFKRKTP